ncbi:MAG: DUF4126 domain-containing protein [Parasphingorhabdus sp.]
MGMFELLGLAGSVSLISGWRLYLTVFVTGLAMRLGWISLPEHLQVLDAFANPWVLAISALGAVAEFFADKILWLDSIWDTIHTAIRPLGGALLALAVVDASDPAWQVIVFLLGGGAALMSHSAKAGARALVNTSPEPVSNAVVSTGEDIATGGLLFLAFANPVAALIIASVLLILCLFLVYKGFKLWRKMVSNGS